VKILLLTTDCYGGHGGIALYNRDVVQALVEIPQVSEVVVVPRVIVHALEPIPKKVRFMKDVAGSRVRYVFAAAKLATEQFDLVICGHIHLLPVAAAIAWARRIPLILMAYGIEVWKAPYRSAARWLRKVDSIWSISAITRDRMNAWAQLDVGRYSLLPNAIHMDKYGAKDKPEALIKRYGLEGSKVIMTLCRLPEAERYKGVDEVLECLPSLLRKQPKLKYLIAGDGDDRPRLEEKTRSLGLSNHVVFTGMVKESEKPDHFRLADAFVMPGRGEGFGFVFLEALACGVPAVGSHVDGSREALRQGLLGELVDPMDRCSIQEGILRALARPKGIPEGLDHFAWPAFSSRVSAAVQKVSSE